MRFLIIILLLTLSLAAEELRIVDRNSLTRALYIVNGPTSITIEVSKEIENLKVENSDGLSEPIYGVKQGNIFIFSNLNAGTWIVKTKTPILKITKN